MKGTNLAVLFRVPTFCPGQVVDLFFFSVYFVVNIHSTVLTLLTVLLGNKGFYLLSSFKISLM